MADAEPGRGRPDDAGDADPEHAGGGGGTQTRLTYEEAVAFITSLGRFGVKLGLERTRSLLHELGDPQRGARGALVAGTNGKGSTAAFLGSILTSAGHHAGTMPSPHLSSYRERVQLDGRPISEPEFASALESLRPALERVVASQGEPTEFEILTALALSHLRGRADRLVIEVGMGGRLDTTNVLNLGVAVITNVSLDHQRYLGSTVGGIAAEKAAIIKPGNSAVTGAEGEALAVVEAAAAAAGARLWRLGRELTVEGRPLGWEGSELTVAGPGFEHRGLRIRLPGRFQLANAALAVAAAEALGDATPTAVATGLDEARWEGRLEWVDGVLLDGAHNPAGMRALAAALAELPLRGAPAVVFAAMADKDLEGLLGELRAVRPRRVLFTVAASAGERGADPERLAALWGEGASACLDAGAALEQARAEGGPVLVCGSLYLVGELRPMLLDSAASPSAPPKDLP